MKAVLRRNRDAQEGPTSHSPFISGVEGKGMFVPDDISDIKSKEAFAEMAIRNGPAAE
jgi:hypothetical protein